MPTQEDRIAALEQNMVSRIDFIDAVNRFTLQQAHNASDMSHQVTILLGVTGSQGQDIRTIKEDVSLLKGDVSLLKGDVSTLKGDVSTLKGDVSTLKGDVSTLKGDVSTLKGHLFSLETTVNEHTTRFDRLETLLAQILTRLPEKP